MIENKIVELTQESLMNKLFCTFTSKDGKSIGVKVKEFYTKD